LTRLIVQIILVSLFVKFIDRLAAGDLPKPVKYPALILITMVYLVVIIVTAYYALFAVEAGPMRRLIAGMCTIGLTAFIYHLLRKSIKNN